MRSSLNAKIDPASMPDFSKSMHIRSQASTAAIRFRIDG
jgi:hypothetical protein